MSAEVPAVVRRGRCETEYEHAGAEAPRDNQRSVERKAPRLAAMLESVRLRAGDQVDHPDRAVVLVYHCLPPIGRCGERPAVSAKAGAIDFPEELAALLLPDSAHHVDWLAGAVPIARCAVADDQLTIGHEAGESHRGFRPFVLEDLISTGEVPEPDGRIRAVRERLFAVRREAAGGRLRVHCQLLQ